MTDHVEAIAMPGRAGRAWALPRPLGLCWLFCRRKPLGAIGAAIILAMMVMALFAEWIAPYPYDINVSGGVQPPSAQFWMGTDNLGRDIFSRVVYGARVSLTVGFGTVLLANFLATIIGVASGYLGGKFDILVQRVVDAWQSFPFFVIALSVTAVLGPGMLNLILALGVIGAAGASRVIRGATIAVVQNPYVEAARALGCGHLRIILRYVLPNVAATIIILATFGLGLVILVESALSFLGVGVPPPYPSWGGMVSGSGRTWMYRAPWMPLWPGVAISMAVFGFNMLGDALRDVLDPRLRGSSGARVR